VRSDGVLSLGSYLDNELRLHSGSYRRDGVKVGFMRYSNVMYYYVRNVYGLEYKSCSSKCVGGVLTGRCILDPWNRCFKVFPDNSSRSYIRFEYSHGYEVYYSDRVYKTVYSDEFKGDRGNIRYNVVLLTTTVHGCMVYCVDILAGAYKHI
jgi:hypothetical protein